MDAAVGGAIMGLCFGKVLIGDPSFLAMSGALTCAYAHHYPASMCRILGFRVGKRLRVVADRSATFVWEVRGSLSGS